MLKLLYQILYFKFPDAIIRSFIRKQRMKTLLTISEVGHYKNRTFIAENIGSLSSPIQLKLILILLNDNIEKISQLAIEKSKEIALNKSQQNMIKEKVQYWENKKIETAQNQKKIQELLKNSTNTKRKFSNGETYQEMKEMIKKPMNLGKWF